jgi:hypothetical protein
MTLRLRQECKAGLMKASMLAAVATGKGKNTACTTRRRIRAFRKSKLLPVNLYGGANDSVIENRDLQNAINEYLQGIGAYVKAQDIVNWFNTPEAEEFTHLIGKPPTLRTAQNWMHVLGYEWKLERRGMFADGHERQDVVHYRQNVFIPRFLALERRMRSWDDEGKEIPPVLEPGEKVVTAWKHDETIYRAHDRRFLKWIKKGQGAGLYKKGEGVSMMVADIVSADHGFLRRKSDEEADRDENELSQHIHMAIASLTRIFSAARVLFRPGKERDGYFNNQDVCRQLDRSCKLAVEEFPDEEHVFFFDNATTHTKLPENAPVVSRMTLGPSLKVWGEKTGSTGEKIKVKMTGAKFADGSPQDLYYPRNHRKPDLRGAFKGLAKILEEREIPGACKLKLLCPKNSCPPGRTDCCARQTMANQPDIRSQKSILELLAESHGCSVVFFP